MNIKLIENYILLGILMEITGVGEFRKLLDEKEIIKLREAIEPLLKTVSAGEQRRVINDLIIRCTREILSEVDKEKRSPLYQ